jgi:ABC-type glycerol-3-phosphate transport system substrate-binding protein
MRFSLKFTLLVSAMPLAFACSALRAQSPAPIVVQAATTATVTSTTATSPVGNAEADQVTIKLLQEMRAANEDVLRKQEVTLQRLDELQKAADQLKIFGKRG